MPGRAFLVTLCLVSGVVSILPIPAAQAAAPGLRQQFTQTVRPFINRYCMACHSGETPAAQFDLKPYSTMDLVVRDPTRWALVGERLTAKEMPPSPIPQPPAESRQQVIDWIAAMRSNEARRNAGDPGLVLARRLSNAEYNYTIRDLTGVDLRPAREFPVDPANPAGFDNSGESLTMSPSLLNKYLQAARVVGDHLVLTPDGFDFSPHPMLVETDRDKYAIKRIVDFYFRQPTDYADYFQAAWRFKYRTARGEPGATLAATAAGAKVSAKYLPMVWQLLEEPEEAAKQEVGPIAKLQAMWRALPAPGANQQDAVRAKCVEMRDFVVRIRTHTAMQFAAPLVRGLPAGSQPLLNWKLRAFASHRRESDPADLRNDSDPPAVTPEIPKRPGLHQEAAPRWAALSAKARSGDPDLVVPSAGRSRYEAAFARFASIFPDTFYVTERGRYFPDDSEDQGRLLSAGYHSVMGFFRDDTPLMELILDKKAQRELNRLWDEFEFIADVTARTWVQYFFNQSGEVQGRGAESGTARPPDHGITDAAVIMGMRDAYLAKSLADPKNDAGAAEAIRDHFDRVDTTLRTLETVRRNAEAKHLDALLQFAARAYRRPLAKAEREDMLAYYRTLREKNGLSHEDAIRDSVVSVLMSPDFCYRIDLLDAAAPPAPRAAVVQDVVHAAAAKTAAAPTVRPLSGYALASRLSYFLWSSMPDQELLAHAAAGDLQNPVVLLAQARRMMKHERARGFVTEFAGNWLDFRRFEQHNAVDRDRFPSFNDKLREAMFEEPIRYIEDAVRNDRSILDLIYGDYTFVNPVLATHYGMPEIPGNDENWVRVDGAGRYQRGGLLPMSVFLTQNSPGLRTSPVKRGYWVVRRVLGEVIPPPPPVVAELPNDESKTDLPVRDMLAKHRENPVCASCHARFDAFGLAFEGYGPTGDARTKDLAGRRVDTKAAFPGGGEGSGFQGIETYIKEHRQNDYLDNFSRKLLAYALNRSLQMSDDLTVQRMQTKLAANGYRFGSLVETVVTSPQFLNRRNPESREKPGLRRHKGE
jgi:Protein of unknown function (DUF1592)/Protein of unknown function (DUF1588)/Protein of unknown function (DUF1587)/Protein of unknown function (DUF1585)/Protein of unknown function (DUF1595)